MEKHALALKRLCEARGGHKRVADAIDANPQTIHQIISGVALPSGNPRGVGPQLRRRLDAAFPGWASGPGSVFDAITDDERKLLEDFRQLTDPERVKYAQEIATRAEELRAYIAQHIAPFKNATKERNQ